MHFSTEMIPPAAGKIRSGRFENLLSYGRHEDLITPSTEWAGMARLSITRSGAVDPTCSLLR
jgi:hypothetical protein